MHVFGYCFRYVPQWPAYHQQQHCDPAEYWWGWCWCSALHNWQDCLLCRYTKPSWAVVLPWWNDGSHWWCWSAILSEQRWYVNSSQPKTQPGFVRDIHWSLLLWNTRPKQCDPDHVCESISHWEWRWAFVFQFVNRCGYTVYICIMCAPHIAIHNSPQSLVSLWWYFSESLQLEHTIIWLLLD